MASYKVLQDVEAEDKLIGPLTIKQLLYALLAVGLWLAGWYVGKSTTWYALLPFAFVSLPIVFMAAPLGRDQPNDVWLEAKANFWLRTRKRLWTQAEHSNRVIIVKSDEDEKPSGAGEIRTSAEVAAQAQRLSSIVDSRGHAAKTRATSAALPPATAPAEQAENEHERRHSQIHERFHNLLKTHHRNRKKAVNQEVRQTLRAQSHGTDGVSAAKPQSFKTRPPKHLSAKISEMAKSGDLKISTLESLVKALKSKEKSRKSNR